MSKLVLVLVVAVFSVCNSSVAPAGKCKHVTPTPFPFDNAIHRHKTWQLLYVPDDEAFVAVESDLRYEVSVSYNSVLAVRTAKEKNGTMTPYVFNLTYGDDRIVYEEAVDIDNEEVLHFKWFPLFKTNHGAALYYRCSDNGSLNIDTRYIVIPRGNEFPAIEEHQLLVADSDYKFKGGMRKLDNPDR